MIVTFFLSDLHACGHVRGEVVARAVNEQYPNHLVVCKTDILISDFKRSNVMVFQRTSEAGAFQKMMLAKRMGIKVVYEVDDDLFNIPPEFQKPYIYYAEPSVRAQIGECLRNADAIITSTVPLAHALKPHSEGVPKYVVPNALDVESWDGVFSRRQAQQANGKVTIGWMASGSHAIDAPLVTQGLQQLMGEYPNLHLHLIGWVGWEQLGTGMAQYKDRIKTEPWVNVVQLPECMSDIDIGLAPLVDNAFNRSKSNIKWAQYAALGAPCIASPLPPYETVTHNEDGFLPPGNTPGAWYAVMKYVLDNPAHRFSAGMKAREELVAKWDVQKTCGNWITVFDRVAA